MGKKTNHEENQKEKLIPRGKFILNKHDPYYAQVEKMINEWPDWKKEIHEKMLRLTT